MHQTTVRFTTDLWAQLQEAAAESGVSAAQFVRDATLTQLAYAAAKREEAGSTGAAHESTARGAERAREDAAEKQKDAGAVWAQARLARERARELRRDAEIVRGPREGSARG